MKPKYTKGDVCVLDPDNIYHQDTNGCSIVVIVDCINPRSIFKEKRYRVFGLNRDGYVATDCFTVPEGLLHNANKLVIRYPDNIPILNAEDIEALKFVVVMCKDYIPEKTMRRILALKDKLDYYNSHNIVREEIV